MNQIERDSGIRSRAEVLRVLAHAGVPEDAIAQIAAQLPDPVDLVEVGQMLQMYGVTRDALISRLGGSP